MINIKCIQSKDKSLVVRTHSGHIRYNTKGVIRELLKDNNNLSHKLMLNY